MSSEVSSNITLWKRGQSNVEEQKRPWAVEPAVTHGVLNELVESGEVHEEDGRCWLPEGEDA